MKVNLNGKYNFFLTQFLHFSFDGMEWFFHSNANDERCRVCANEV